MSEKITIQDFDDDKLVINNVEIAGWIDDENCEFCNHQRCTLNALMIIFAHTAIVG